MRNKLLYIGGSLTLLFALLHLSFWQLCNWSEELVKLNPGNQGIMQMLNVGSIFMLLYCAVMTFYITRLEKFDFAAQSILVLTSGYFLLRIIFGVPFFGCSIEEIIIWIVCLLVALMYLIALQIDRRNR